MSNPTELPDLDRIANDLESEAIPYEGDFADAVRAAIEDIREIAAARRAQPEGFVSKSAYDAATSLAGEVIDARNAEISDLRAQLAQPEGEAPQTDLGDRWHSLTCDGTCSPPCKDAPAAQHAESGAPVYEVFDVNVGGWHKANKAVYELASLGFRRVVYGDMPAESGAPVAVRRWTDSLPAERAYADPRTKREEAMCAEIDAWRNIAAQSQGAPVARFRWSKRGMEQDANGYYVPFSAIAAKAEAPADDPYVLDDDDEVRFPNDTQVAIVSVKRYYELRGFEERAQQAAAPGALERLRAAFHVNMLRAYPDKSHDEIAAEIEKAISAAPSAPGTPEALRYTCIGKGGEYELVGMVYGAGTSAGQIMTLYREVSTDVMYFRTPGDFNARMQRLDRAAQLDGGQGEGK